MAGCMLNAIESDKLSLNPMSFTNCASKCISELYFFHPLPKAFRYINVTCAWLLPYRNGYSLMECLLPFWYSIEIPISCATAIHIFILWTCNISHILNIYIISNSAVFIMVNGLAGLSNIEMAVLDLQFLHGVFICFVMAMSCSCTGKRG